jgi:hypothetical protein
LSREAYALIEKMFFDGMHVPGLAINLRAWVVREYVQDTTISAGVGDGLDKAQRPGHHELLLCGTSLNTPVVKAKVSALWGNIELSVIGDYVRMVLEFFEKAQAAARVVGKREVL